jgi:hypothetical protein
MTNEINAAGSSERKWLYSRSRLGFVRRSGRGGRCFPIWTRYEEDTDLAYFRQRLENANRDRKFAERELVRSTFNVDCVMSEYRCQALTRAQLSQIRGTDGIST